MQRLPRRPQPLDGEKMTDGTDPKLSKLLQYVEPLSDQFDADIWIYSGPIDDYGFGEAIKEFTIGKTRSKAIVFLVTNGGSANVAYQIARLFQNGYDDFYICAPSYCKSAGTLIAIGANKLYMDNFSELGPLDVQLTKQNEIAISKSGLLTGSTFDALTEISFEMFQNFMLRITLSGSEQITFKTASEISSSMTTGLMSEIFKQINPDVIGSDYRDLSVALHYGRRLADIGGNCDLGSVMKLVRNYPSHDYIIAAEEAAELFNEVEEPDDLMYGFLGEIGDVGYNEANPAFVVNYSRFLKGSSTSKTGKTEASDEVQQVDEGRDADRSSDPEQAGDSGAIEADSDDSAQDGSEANFEPRSRV